MSVVSSAPHLEQLTYADRLQLAWALSWPCAVFGSLYLLARGLLGFSALQFNRFDICVGLGQLFLFSPWVVRRTIRLDFPRFHLVVIRGQSGESTRAMGYRESLSVAWLLIWRTAVISGITQGLFFAVVRLVQGSRLPLFDPNYVTPPGVLGILRALQNELLSLLIFLIWVNDTAIRKAYARFSLRVEPAELRAGSPPVSVPFQP